EEDLENLKKYLKPFLPDFYITYGDGKHGITAYMFMEQVQPTDTTGENEQQFCREFDDFIRQCETMYLTTFNKNTQRGVTFDVNVKSNIFGKTIKNPAPRLYLIDLYPTVHAQPDALATDIEILIKTLEQKHDFIFLNAHNFIKKLKKMPS
ncbi:MAG: hypothetical protein NTX98_01595, partial [Candidatus Doudnabacteria bacterium]|nr:hypothetical protein [Candidatus Doudnabacteria bacterium]